MVLSKFLGRRARLALLAVASASALVACGGGTSQKEVFIAERLFAFGDETSVLTASGPQPEFRPGGALGADGPAGRKYSVNIIVTDTTVTPNVSRIDCASQPIWVQTVASFYGFVFAECNPNAVAAPKALMRATIGAKVADAALQVEAQVTAGGFRDKDMSTLLIGANDLFALYEQFPTRSEADLLVDARNLGRQAAALANRLINLGSKVLVSTVPDLGLSPYAIAQKALHTGADRAALLSNLSTAFNEQLGVNLLQDGRYVGFVQTDLRSRQMVRSPISFGLANVTQAVCAAPLPDCSSSTLVTDGDAAAYMWADAKRLSYGGQLQIGSLAITVAGRNPF